ncbi:MAG: hypothetical protein MR902_07935, partial [Campylobacter sp.]|nr:hypothetical protein [Campylobacter sp.]
LASEVAQSFDKCSVERIKVTSKKETFDIKSGKIIKNESEFIKDSELGDAFIAQNLKKFAITNGYPLKFILKIYSKISNHQNFKNNSLKAFKTLDDIIKNAVHQTIISKVEYNFSSTTITKNSPFYHLFDEKENPKEMIETSKLGRYESPAKPQPNYLYDKTIYDSDIEKNAIENDPATLKIKNSKSQIKVFAKLPKFSIPTPFKEYQPDFAYLIENDKGKKIFFICETKGYDSESKIPTNEKFKIDYAKVFFKRLDEFIKTSSPNTQVVFKTRINKQELIDILGEIL